MAKIGQIAKYLNPFAGAFAARDVNKAVKNNGLKESLGKYYDLTPQKYALEQTEASQIRAEQREKEYNSPTAQMQRYKDAGLNPHLIYGQGTPGNVQSSGSQMSPPPGIGQTALAAIQLGAQIANISSTSALRATQMGINVARLPQIEAGTDLLKQKFDFLGEMNPKLLDQVQSKIDNLDITNENLLQVGKNLKSTGMLIDAKKETELMRQGLLGQDGLIKEEVLNSYKLKNKLAREINPSLVSIKGTAAEIQKLYGEEIAWLQWQQAIKKNGLLDQQGRLNEETIKGANINNALQNAELQFVANGQFNSKQFWTFFLKMMTGAQAAALR